MSPDSFHVIMTFQKDGPAIAGTWESGAVDAVKFQKFVGSHGSVDGVETTSWAESGGQRERLRTRTGWGSTSRRSLRRQTRCARVAGREPVLSPLPGPWQRAVSRLPGGVDGTALRGHHPPNRRERGRGAGRKKATRSGGGRWLNGAPRVWEGMRVCMIRTSGGQARAAELLEVDKAMDLRKGDRVEYKGQEDSQHHTGTVVQVMGGGSSVMYSVNRDHTQTFEPVSADQVVRRLG
ncbi:hypothetical protein [Streptomyces sp. A1136]|uniref:hypothetical protein n=1 Tax=Streptomyces sp. A1136 TaxID=2563102 RepID=UPI00109E9549|nr:hypothetical protein [Streptomyces sp. A1136]THA45667.1 hypothetical protein E6R62_35250 [Streptomyces sp. A1136]